MLLPALCAVACVATPQGQGGRESAMHIELDVFSGRPNPVWTLTATEAAELETMVAALPVMGAPPPAFDGLGYRGIVARKPGVAAWSLVAYRDTVRIRTPKGSDVRADPGASVERWLLGTAGDAVDPALRARLGY